MYKIIIALALLTSGCALGAGDATFEILENDREVLQGPQCKVNVPEYVESGWDAPVVSAWPKGFSPTVNVVAREGIESCTPEEIKPVLDFWCETVGVCMKLQYIYELPSEDKQEYGNIYFVVEDLEDQNKAGQTGWQVFSCGENHHATVRVRRCATDVVAHEIGHSLGYMHSTNPNDTMFYVAHGQALSVSTGAIAAYRLAQIPVE